MQAATVATSGVYVCRPRNRQGIGSEGRVTIIVSPLPTTTAALDTITDPLTTTMVTTTAARIITESATTEEVWINYMNYLLCLLMCVD